MTDTAPISEAAVRNALARVDDPEIGKPITELDMVESVRIDGRDVAVGIYLTIAGCPMRDTIESNVRAVLEELEGVGEVSVTMHTMSEEQRRNLAQRLKGDRSEPVIPFAQPGSTCLLYTSDAADE